MKDILLIIFFFIIFVYFNLYKLKRIKRKANIKRMNVDDRIIELINEFKTEIKKDSELKRIQNQMRIIKILKYILYLIFIVFLFAPFIYIVYIIGFKEIFPSYKNICKMYILYEIFIFTYMFFLWSVNNWSLKKYQENKSILKEYIYKEYLKKINYNIKWYNKENNDFLDKNINIRDILIILEDAYAKASFNKIQEKNENVLLSTFSNLNELYFEDDISGVYKEKNLIAMSDFKEYQIISNGRYRTRRLKNEGIFCKVKMEKKIDNEIRITNNKKLAHYMQKQYMVTTMPDEFNKNFIIIAKNGSKLSEKISKNSLEIIEKFYNNSKIKFDISIRSHDIFFRFKTVDTMELNTWGNIVDDLMLKEYANILLFIIELCEEINNNWLY